MRPSLSGTRACARIALASLIGFLTPGRQSQIRGIIGQTERRRAWDCADAPKIARLPIHDGGVAFDGAIERQIGAITWKQVERRDICLVLSYLHSDSHRLRGW